MSNIWRYEVHTIEEDSQQTGISHVHYRTDVPTLEDEPSAATVLDAINDHFSTSGHNLTKWTNAMYSSCKLVKTVVRQEVETWNGDIAATAEEAHTLLGTLAIGTAAQSPSGLCVWLAYKTGVATRSARGGTHAPSGQSALTLDTAGRFDSTTTWWTNVNNLGNSIVDALENVFSATGDLNPGVYSRVRRQRGDSPFFWPLTNAIPDPDPRWLRRRANL